MKDRYKKLKELLADLFQELQFPIGGENDDLMSIYMSEGENHRMTAMVTTDGYIVVYGDGRTLRCQKIQMVEGAFLVYFKKQRECINYMANKMELGA